MGERPWQSLKCICVGRDCLGALLFLGATVFAPARAEIQVTVGTVVVSVDEDTVTVPVHVVTDEPYSDFSGQIEIEALAGGPVVPVVPHAAAFSTIGSVWHEALGGFQTFVTGEFPSRYAEIGFSVTTPSSLLLHSGILFEVELALPDGLLPGLYLIKMKDTTGRSPGVFETVFLSNLGGLQVIQPTVNNGLLTVESGGALPRVDAVVPRLEVTAGSAASGTIELSFQSEADVGYDLFQTDSLPLGRWELVPGVRLVGTGDLLRTTVSLVEGMAFYRLSLRN